MARRYSLKWLSLLLVAAGISSSSPAQAEADITLLEAVQAYDDGRLDKALALLTKDLKEHPNDGMAHYYLGCVFKKAGADASAIHELEAAIQLCPPGITQTLAKKALHGDFQEEAAAPPAAPSNWFSSVLAMFQPAPKDLSTAPPSASDGWQMPDFFKPMRQTVKEAKAWIKTQTEQNPDLKALVHKSPPNAPVPPVSTQADLDVISMGEMQSIVSESRQHDQRWQSHPSGVSRFPQAPEDTVDWDRWIGRYRSAFNNQLFRHLAKEAKDETGGTASIIFSVDKEGHLRGCVYEATADDRLVNCLLETVREMDKSYVLSFPPSSRITGWNFRTQWNFRKALAVIKIIRDRKAAAMIAAARLQFVALKTDAQIKPKVPPSGERAEAKKLPVTATSAKLSMPPLVVKTGVSGLVLPKPKPIELKAVPLKLSDMKVLPISPQPPVAPPSLNDRDIDDLNIMNQDVSGLFQ